MPISHPTLSLDELAQLGSSVLDRRVKPVLQQGDDGKFVAIDVRSEQFELDPDDFLAVTRLLNRIPDAEVWLGRVGGSTAYRLGSSR